MHCPKCGVEVVEQAMFCHKCGERIDLPAPGFSPERPEMSQGMPEGTPAEPRRESLKGPAEQLQDFAAGGRAGVDEPEQELWRGSYSPKAMIGGWILSGLISVVVLLIWIKWVPGSWWFWMLLLMILPWAYHFILAHWRRWNVSYVLSDQRFIHETGVLRRVTDRIEVIDMDDIAFEQKLLERMVGVGTIRISSSDRTHPELVLKGIKNVKQVAEKIDNARRAERRRRGLHIESI